MDALTDSPLFPYFGGKRTIAETVWRYFGEPDNYVEPFFGSGAVLFAREHPCPSEIVNDADCFVANFWRSLQADAEAVSQWADWPINEADLHARHRWLMRSEHAQAWRERMKTDPDAYDAKIAGWWVWGLCQWIGRGWCAGGLLEGRDGGASNKRPDMVNSRGVIRQLPSVTCRTGIHRKRHNLTDRKGVHRQNDSIIDLIGRFAERLQHVRVCCGDWSRVLTPCVTVHNGLTAVFLDPPYGALASRDANIYAVDSLDIAASAQQWAVEHGDDPSYRIILCGYEGEHVMPESWRVVPWKAQGGYANMQNGAGRENRHRERLWISPHCERGSLLDWMDRQDDADAENGD